MDNYFSIKYCLYSLLFAYDKSYIIKRHIFNRIVKINIPEKNFYIIFSRKLKKLIIVPPSRFSDYLVGHEPKVIRTLKQLLSHGTVFIDVGAFIGFYSLLAANLGAKVIALKPDPRSFKIFLYNIKLSGKQIEKRILAINSAAGSKEGSLTLKLADTLAESSATDYLSSDKVMRTIKVPSISLDTLVSSQGLKRVDVVKIDVEGYGYDVIKGASSTIKEFKPHIILEVHRTSTYNNELKAVNLLVKEFNYTYQILEFRSQQNFILHLKPPA